MSWFEKSHLLQALRAALAYAIFLWLFLGWEQAGRFIGEAGLRELGLVHLVFAAATIGAGILLHILVTILAVTSGEEMPVATFDERDRLIEQRSMTHAFSVASFGVLLALVALWQGWGPVWAVGVIVGGLVAADLTVDLHRFAAYRRGG